MKIINILIIFLGCALLGSIAAATSPGGNWTEINSSAGFSPRYFQGGTTFNNQLWIIGGSSGNTTLGDVWSSYDGNHWTLVTDQAGFGPRYGQVSSLLMENSGSWGVNNNRPRMMCGHQ